MARVCQVTGKKVVAGNAVSHSHRKTKRTFAPNLSRKRFWFADESRFVRLRVSAKGIKIINQRGVAAVIRELRGRGVKV